MNTILQLYSFAITVATRSHHSSHDCYIISPESGDSGELLNIFIRIGISVGILVVLMYCAKKYK